MNFVFAPVPELGATQRLRFQQHLAASPHFLEFDTTSKQGERFVLQRSAPPFRVTFGPVNAQLAQLVVAAERPSQALEEFIADAESVVSVYREEWPGLVQVVSRDCTIRHLCPVKEGHSFKYLWENRLRQKEEDLGILGRPVLGGGLRLVMPSRPNVPDDPIVEVKIESLFEDTSQLFIDASFVWRQPQVAGELRPKELLEAVDGYLRDEVTRFIIQADTEGPNDDLGA